MAERKNGSSGNGPSRVGSESTAELVEHFLRRVAEADRHPKIVLDGRGNVLWQSEEAERLLQPPLPLSLKGGKLVAAGPGARAWREFLEDLGPAGARLLLKGQSAATWVLVRGWAERRGSEQAIFLKCALSWPLRDVASSGLAQDFGLTRSESAVLDEFARLSKPAQIAERLDISLSTVRSHFKQIHAKLAVNSSTQLLRITRAYCDS